MLKMADARDRRAWVWVGWGLRRLQYAFLCSFHLLGGGRDGIGVALLLVMVVAVAIVVVVVRTLPE